MEAQYALLKQFVNLLKSNPNILHDPKLDFLREYIESLGGTIPPKVHQEESQPKPTPTETDVDPEPMEEDVPEIPYPELDNSGVVEPDSGVELPMGDPSKEATEEDLEKANEARDEALTAFSDGDFEKAVDLFSKAIELNPGSAIMHAKRANALLKLKRPVAAIADCDKAISINPDSAQGYKFRGRAKRLLGKWIEAHSDLATACKLDYDDVANEWLKEVEPNAKKLLEYNRAVERQKEEKDIKERIERNRKIREANQKAAEEAAKARAEDDGDLGGLGGMFNDPEIAGLMADPEVQKAFVDIQSNPQNLMKYMGNPKIMKVIGKLQGAFGGMGGGMPFGMGGGMSDAGAAPTGGCPRSECQDRDCGASSATAPPPTSKPAKAPEPDLD